MDSLLTLTASTYPQNAYALKFTSNHDGCHSPTGAVWQLKKQENEYIIYIYFA